MKFDRGSTTFDLQDTEFYDKYELFEQIKRSHIKPYREERDLTCDSDIRISVNQHYTL